MVFLSKPRAGEAKTGPTCRGFLPQHRRFLHSCLPQKTLPDKQGKKCRAAEKDAGRKKGIWMKCVQPSKRKVAPALKNYIRVRAEELSVDEPCRQAPPSSLLPRPSFRVVRGNLLCCHTTMFYVSRSGERLSRHPSIYGTEPNTAPVDTSDVRCWLRHARSADRPMMERLHLQVHVQLQYKKESSSPPAPRFPARITTNDNPRSCWSIYMNIVARFDSCQKLQYISDISFSPTLCKQIASHFAKSPSHGYCLQSVGPSDMTDCRPCAQQMQI